MACLDGCHAFGDQIPDTTLAFTSAGVPIAEDAAMIETGLDSDLNDGTILGLSYQGQFGSDTREHGFVANLKVRF
ncbi:MAG: autotransporter outer membrane beta-barrel domain-containing protein [Shinella sp.]|nr:autotransporter outer membrane beta-barrel domain-containing protein [Shinella sp.]